MTTETFALPARPEAPAAARRRARAAARDRLPDDAAEMLYLLITELVANALEHGSVPGEIEVTITFHDGRVEVTVDDPGGGFARAADAVSPRPGGGFGLHLVDGLAERWGVSCDQRTRVWFELPCVP